MRFTTVLRKLLAVTQLLVTGYDFEEEALVIPVRPRWRKPRCSGCGKPRPGYDQRPERKWKHLPFGWFEVQLSYAPRRVDCPRCGVLVEQVPWAPTGSRFTWDFEEKAAYLAQVTDKTKVSKLLGISWRTVGEIVERVVARNLDERRFEGLRCIGIDEFSYRKRHRFVTVVVDHDRRQVIWASEGKSSDTLEGFFKELGVDRCFNIKEVTIDMSAAFRKAIDNWLPQAQIVYDRFHVQQLASAAVDEVRRQQVRESSSSEEAKVVKGTRFALLKNPWALSRKDQQKLKDVQRNNQRLYRAYLLKETLAGALDYKQPKRARRALREWVDWACRSKLDPFVRASRTIRKHFEEIIAYVRTRETNGLVEGLNNKLRMIARRAYGFHSAGALISMLFLCSGGIHLSPPLPGRSPLKR